MTAAPVKGVSSTLPWWCSSSTEAMVPYSYQSLIMMPYSDFAEFNTNTTTTTPSYFEPDWWNMTPPPTQNEIQQALAVPKLENFMEDSHSHPPPLLPPSSSSSFGGGCGAAHSQTESSSSLTNVYNNNNNDDDQTVKIPPFEGSMSGGSRVMPTTNYNNNTTTNELYHHHHPLAICPSPQPNSMITAPNNSEPQLSNSRKLITTSTNNVTFGQRTSIYRGVTRHRWTGRYEAHLWDNSYRKEGQARKGRQVYLGGYDMEEKAARSYDLAALKYWGPTATTNFSVADYTNEMKDMENVTRQEFIASLRRKSSGFSRGASIYRGVTRHHQQGRWQARIGRVAGNKDLYLGTFGTEEEAAEAYDIAAIKFRGLNAVTNFEMSRYDVEAIENSSLPIGGSAAKRLKFSLETEPAAEPLLLDQRQHESNSSSTSTVAVSTVALSHLSHAYNPGSISGSSSDSTCSNTTAGPLVVFPSPEFCSRNFLYSFGDSVNFNHNPPSKANYQPWSVVPLSN